MNPQITQIAQIEKPCERAICPIRFRPKRRHQKYCSPRCRRKAYEEKFNRKRVRRRERAASGGRKSVVRRFLRGMDAQSPLRDRRTPIEANSSFSYQQAPGNIKGLLARVAIASPKVMLRLAAAHRRDAEAAGKGLGRHGAAGDPWTSQTRSEDETPAQGRPSCIGCPHVCADGLPCAILAREL